MNLLTRIFNFRTISGLVLFLCLIGTIVDVIIEMCDNRKTVKTESGFPFLAENPLQSEDPSTGPSKMSLHNDECGDSTANLISGHYQSGLSSKILKVLKLLLGI